MNFQDQSPEGIGGSERVKSRIVHISASRHARRGTAETLIRGRGWESQRRVGVQRSDHEERSVGSRWKQTDAETSVRGKEEGFLSRSLAIDQSRSVGGGLCHKCRVARRGNSPAGRRHRTDVRYTSPHFWRQPPSLRSNPRTERSSEILR